MGEFSNTIAALDQAPRLQEFTNTATLPTVTESARSSISSDGSDSCDVNYYLVNIDGDTIHSIHMGIEEFPSGNQPGTIVYEYCDRSVDRITFRLNKRSTEKQLILDAWPEDDPNYIFQIYPVLEGDDLVGLDARFDQNDPDQFVVHFRADDDYDEEMDELADDPTIEFMEMETVGC